MGWRAPWCAATPVDLETWLRLGHDDHGEPGQPFNMTALAVRTSARLRPLEASLTRTAEGYSGLVVLVLPSGGRR